MSTISVREFSYSPSAVFARLDALHVASALSLERELVALVTYDRRMLDAASKEGLPAHVPGLQE